MSFCSGSDYRVPVPNMFDNMGEIYLINKKIKHAFRLAEIKSPTSWSHVRKPLSTNMDLTYICVSNTDPWASIH